MRRSRRARERSSKAARLGLVLAAALLVAPALSRAQMGELPDEGRPYICDERTGRCTCTGIVSCEYMRNSGDCANFSCAADTCTCDWVGHAPKPPEPKPDAPKGKAEVPEERVE